MDSNAFDMLEEALELLKRWSHGDKCVGEFTHCDGCITERNRVNPFIIRLNQFVKEHTPNYTGRKKLTND